MTHQHPPQSNTRFRSKQPGNSLLYLLVIVTVMAVSLTGIIQILRPLHTYSSLTSDRRLMMEELAQQHIRKIRLHMKQNASVYLNDASYGSVNTGPDSPDYLNLSNGVWATVSPSIATLTSTTPDVPATWRLNSSDLGATSTLAQADLRRMTQGVYAGVFQVNLTVTSGPYTTTYRKRFTVTPDMCEGAQTTMGETYTVAYADTANPGTESFEVGRKRGPFMEFPGYKNICWAPHTTTAGALPCVYNSNRAAAFSTGNHYLLHGYSAYYPGGPASYNMITLENAVSANEDRFAIRTYATEGQAGAGTASLTIPLNNANVGTTNDYLMAAPGLPNGFRPHNVGVLGLPPSNKNTTEIQRALIFYFDRSVANFYLRAMHVTWTGSAISTPNVFSDASPGGFSGIGEFTSENQGYDPTGAAGVNGEVFTLADMIGVSPNANAIVVTDNNSGKVYANRLKFPAAGASTPMRLEFNDDGGWIVGDSGLGTATFGQPVLDSDGQFAVVPLITAGPTMRMMVLRLSNDNNEKIDATKNMRSCGTPTNFDELMRFDQSIPPGYTTPANGITVTALNNVFTWYDPHLNKFFWMVRSANENSNTIYSWDPQLWGVMQNVGGTCPAATPANWVQAAETGLTTQINNVRFRGLQGSATPVTANTQAGSRWVGKHRTVEVYPLQSAISALWPTTGNVAVSVMANRRAGEIWIRGGDRGGRVVLEGSAYGNTMFTNASSPRNRIMANIPGLSWSFQISNDGLNTIQLVRRASPTTANYISSGAPTLTNFPGDAEGNMNFSMRNGVLMVTDEASPKAGPSFNLRTVRPFCYNRARKYSVAETTTGFTEATSFNNAFDFNETQEQGLYGRYE